MRSIHYKRNSCRLCLSQNLNKVFALKPSPPANAWQSFAELQTPQEKFPLDVYLCESCGHVQLLDVLSPEILFSHYVYVSNTSPVFVRHFHEMAQTLYQRFILSKNSLRRGLAENSLSRFFILEIGSNDGTLLKAFSTLTFQRVKVLGIEPAVKIASRANIEGVPTWNEFFSADVASRVLKTHGQVNLIIANNVFAHMDDLIGCVQSIHDLMTPAGVFVFEVSYLLNVIRDGLFDTIYHEHLSYHSVEPLIAFFSRYGLELFDVESIPTHGGSIRCYVQKKGDAQMITPALAHFVAQEQAEGLRKPERYQSFIKKIESSKSNLLNKIKEIKSRGKTIAGYGAPAKATTLMHHFEINQNILDFIVDDSIYKQGLFSPGFHVPVKSPEVLKQQAPDYLLLLAWNFAEDIINSKKAFTANGGRFLIPLPVLREVGNV